MKKGVRLLHFLGLICFLGTIITFTIISSLLENSTLEQLAFGRTIISTGTTILTLPGMWVIALTGIWMGYRQYGIKQRFFQLKLLLISVIIANAYLFVAPAVEMATTIAHQSLQAGKLLPDYQTAYLRESTFGALNVLLTLAAATIGVWRVGAKDVRV